jgi:ankyrin repeat protein
MALAAPISLNDAEGVHLLLEAGADPNRYADDADPLSPVIYAAIRSGCSAELTGLLLGYGADPHIPGPDGRSPYVLAVTQGRTGLAMLLRQHGADVTVTGADRLLAACQDADRAKVERLLAADPGLPGRVPVAQQAAAMIHAAESGHTAAIALMLDLGFPVDARGDDGGTALHAAAYSGSAPARALRAPGPAYEHPPVRVLSARRRRRAGGPAGAVPRSSPAILPAVAAGPGHDCKLSGCRPHACKPMKANTIRQIHSILSGAFVAARELFMDAENLSWFATEETACS